jgi:hypothetical protein
MIRIIAILLFISLFSLHSEHLVSKAWSGTTEDKGRITAVSTSTNIFALELYKRIKTFARYNPLKILVTI